MCVSWEDARAYVNWLSGATGEEYRLLTESEWEYVARAGTTGPFHFGSTISMGQASYDVNYIYGGGSEEGGFELYPPRWVGGFPANGFGLHDVHGNVWEFVEDCWHDSYHDAPSDGSAWISGGDCGKRVARGGSWNYKPKVPPFGESPMDPDGVPTPQLRFPCRPDACPLNPYILASRFQGAEPLGRIILTGAI